MLAIAQGLVEEESKPSSTPSVIDLTKEDYSSPSMPDVVMEAFKISKEEFKRVSIGSQTRYIPLGIIGARTFGEAS